VTLCSAKSDEDDEKALQLINDYPALLNHQQKDDSNKTCLMKACYYGRPTVARALLDKGAVATITSDSGSTALHMAAGGGSVECAKVLLDAHVELLNVKARGYTALDWAIELKQRECGEYLRSRGAECCNKEYPADWKKKGNCLLF